MIEVTIHRMKRTMLILLTVVGVVVGGFSPAYAAPPPTSGEIVLDQPGPLEVGDVVTFTTTATGTRGSSIRVACTRVGDGATVFDETRLDTRFTVFRLAGWTGDAACTATLLHRRGDVGRILDTTEPFLVDG